MTCRDDVCVVVERWDWQFGEFENGSIDDVREYRIGKEEGVGCIVT